MCLYYYLSYCTIIDNKVIEWLSSLFLCFYDSIPVRFIISPTLEIYIANLDNGLKCGLLIRMDVMFKESNNFFVNQSLIRFSSTTQLAI